MLNEGEDRTLTGNKGVLCFVLKKTNWVALSGRNTFLCFAKNLSRHDENNDREWDEHILSQESELVQNIAEGVFGEGSSRLNVVSMSYTKANELCDVIRFRSIHIQVRYVQSSLLTTSHRFLPQLLICQARRYT